MKYLYDYYHPEYINRKYFILMTVFMLISMNNFISANIIACTFAKLFLCHQRPFTRIFITRETFPNSGTILSNVLLVSHMFPCNL